MASYSRKYAKGPSPWDGTCWASITGKQWYGDGALIVKWWRWCLRSEFGFAILIINPQVQMLACSVKSNRIGNRIMHSFVLRGNLNNQGGDIALLLNITGMSRPAPWPVTFFEMSNPTYGQYPDIAPAEAAAPIQVDRSVAEGENHSNTRLIMSAYYNSE